LGKNFRKPQGFFLLTLYMRIGFKAYAHVLRNANFRLFANADSVEIFLSRVCDKD